jgi:hypothetical protein
MFGVQVAGAVDTRPDSGTAAPAGATPSSTRAALETAASSDTGNSRRIEILQLVKSMT